MRDERGQVGGIEAVAFGTLVFVLGLLVIVNAWAVVDSKLAAAAAAREAARAYVESPSAATADDDARRAAEAALRGYGRDPARMTLRRTEGTFGRCRRVTFSVEYAVPLAAIPAIARTRATFVAAARHSELVDPFRSGLAGEALCA
jgi:Flp pilus assembly protein TadG